MEDTQGGSQTRDPGLNDGNPYRIALARDEVGTRASHAAFEPRSSHDADWTWSASRKPERLAITQPRVSRFGIGIPWVSYMRRSL